MNNQITCIQLATFFTLDFARDHSIDVHHSLETEKILYVGWTFCRFQLCNTLIFLDPPSLPKSSFLIFIAEFETVILKG